MKIDQALIKAEQKGLDLIYLICYDKDIGHYTDIIYISFYNYINDHGQSFNTVGEVKKHYSLIDGYEVFDTAMKMHIKKNKLKQKNKWITGN